MCARPRKKEKGELGVKLLSYRYGDIKAKILDASAPAANGRRDSLWRRDVR